MSARLKDSKELAWRKPARFTMGINAIVKPTTIGFGWRQADFLSQGTQV